MLYCSIVVNCFVGLRWGDSVFKYLGAVSMNQKDKKQIANFLFEVGILAKTPRSGLHFLGTGEQSVAEHINRAAYIGYVLAVMDGTVDIGKVLKMCLLHDITETRISDLNYVHQKYTERLEEKAWKDMAASVPFGKDFEHAIEEYEQRESRESHLVKDADNLEWILTLKEQVDVGNERANDWLVSAVKRLKTDIAKEIAEEILQTDSNEWWFGDKNDEWWVSRGKTMNN